MVGLGLMLNASVIILAQRRLEGGCLEIQDDIIVSRVKSANQKKSLVRELLINTNRKRSRG